jgi:hypothetical protein
MASNNIKLEEEVPGIGDKARKGLQPSRFQKRNPHLHIALAVGALPLPSSTGIRVVTTGRCELPGRALAAGDNDRRVLAQRVSSSQSSKIPKGSHENLIPFYQFAPLFLIVRRKEETNWTRLRLQVGLGQVYVGLYIQDQYVLTVPLVNCLFALRPFNNSLTPYLPS